MIEAYIKVDNNLCIGCLACLRDCPQGEFRIKDGHVFVTSKRCIKCGHCFAVCPTGAISTLKSNEVISVIEKPTRLEPAILLDLLRQRRTIRQFDTSLVPDNVLTMILEAGRITHTGRNRQGLIFSVLRDHRDEVETIGLQLFRRIKSIGSPFSAYLRQKNLPDDFFFYGAPLVIVISGKHEADAIFAAANMEYMAETFGLGVLHSGFFTIAANYSRKLRVLLKIPPKNKALATLVLGYPNVHFYRTVSRDPLNVTYL